MMGCKKNVLLIYLGFSMQDTLRPLSRRTQWLFQFQCLGVRDHIVDASMGNVDVSHGKYSVFPSHTTWLIGFPLVSL